MISVPPCSIMAVFKFSHLSNAPYSIRFIEEGILIDVSPLHPSNAEEPMLVTPSGILIDVSPLHPQNV